MSSSPTGFPLLKLPYLALNEVLLKFELNDLIHFAFSSKRLYRIVKNLRIKFESFEIFVNKERTIVVFKCLNNGPEGGWHFNNDQFTEDFKNHPVTVSLNGVKLRTISCENKCLYSYTDGPVQQSTQAGIAYLRELFRCPLPRVYVRSDDIPLSRYPILIGFDECQNLNIMGSQKMRNEELSRILQKITVREQIVLNVPIKKSFKFDLDTCHQPNKVFIPRDAHWVTSEMMFNIKSSHITLNSDKITFNDCRLFVKRWFDSVDTQFSCLQVCWNDGHSQRARFDDWGLELMEFDPKIRNSAFRYDIDLAVNMSTGYDFYRPSDGLLATIKNSECFFMFCVWHERFPNMDGAKIV